MKKFFTVALHAVMLYLVLSTSAFAGPPSAPIAGGKPWAVPAAGDDGYCWKYNNTSGAMELGACGTGVAEIEDDAYGAGWNGDTTHGASQNALYDLLHVIDQDDDGVITDEEWSIAGFTITGANQLALGVAGTVQGNIRWFSNTPGNNYHCDLYGANFTENWGIRLQTAYPLVDNALFNVDMDGTGGWTDPATFLATAGTDNVKDTHIDWGTGANQVSAVDLPIADVTSQFTATTVEAALDELHDDIEGLGGGHDALTLGASLSSIFSLTDQELGLTAWPTFNQNTTGTAAGLTAQYIDWSSESGGSSIANKPTIPSVDNTPDNGGSDAAGEDWAYDFEGLLDSDHDGSLADESPTFASVTVGAHAYDAVSWDGNNEVPTKDAVRDKIESISAGPGDITSVGATESGAVDQLVFTPIPFADGDTTPDVSTGTVYITANTSETIYSDFDTSLKNGQFLYLIVNDSYSKFDMTSSGLEGAGGEDYTATPGDLVLGVYSTTDNQWHMLFLPSTMAVESIQEGVKWADGDGTGTIAWSFATSDDRTIAIPGDADQTLATLSASNTFTGANDYGGATSLEIPNSDDPDVDAAGELSWDTDGWLRAFDGTNQVAVGRKIEAIHVTVITPNDLADAQRDAFLFWSNESGMSFIVTGWKGWSGTDDTTLNIEEADADGVSNNATVDAVELATGSGPYTGSDTTITGATIENGHVLLLDFDDTDTPTYVKMTIYGYYNADVN